MNHLRFLKAVFKSCVYAERTFHACWSTLSLAPNSKVQQVSWWNLKLNGPLYCQDLGLCCSSCRKFLFTPHPKNSNIVVMMRHADTDTEDEDEHDIHHNWDPSEFSRRKLAFCTGKAGPHYPRSTMYKAVFMWQILLIMLQHPPKMPAIEISCRDILAEYISSIATALDVYATVMTPSTISLSVMGLTGNPCRIPGPSAAKLPMAVTLPYSLSSVSLSGVPFPYSSDYPDVHGLSKQKDQLDQLKRHRLMPWQSRRPIVFVCQLFCIVPDNCRGMSAAHMTEVGL